MKLHLQEKDPSTISPWIARRVVLCLGSVAAFVMVSSCGGQHNLGMFGEKSDGDGSASLAGGFAAGTDRMSEKGSDKSKEGKGCRLGWDKNDRNYFILGAQCDPSATSGEDVCPPNEPSTGEGGFGLVESLNPPQLSSLPTATKTVYLDFTGHTLSASSIWNERTDNADIVIPSYDTDGNVYSFNDRELAAITEIYERVSGDFRPFNINVTTVEPVVSDLMKENSTDQRWGIRVVIGGSASLLSQYSGQNFGGVAYYNSFNWSSDEPALVFENALGSPKSVAEAASHEVGHALNLPHQGNSTTTYYGGSGSGVTSWAPIMGYAYRNSITTWNNAKDPLSGAVLNGSADELATITGTNGFSFRPDDHGNDLESASVIPPSLDGAFSITGLISTNTDSDVFQIDSLGGTISALATPTDFSPNVVLGLEILDSRGILLASVNPLDDNATLSAPVTLNAAAPGTYYLRVKKSEYYGFLGAFRLSGNFLGDTQPDIDAPVASIESALPISLESIEPARILIRYTDNRSVAVSSFDSSDLVISRDGVANSLRYIGASFDYDGATRVATYEVAAPGGKWDTADNGEYQIELVAGQVTDSVGNAALGAVLGSFSVDIRQINYFALSGRITFEANTKMGVPSVNIDNGLGGSVRSDASGAFSFVQIREGAYFTISPSRAGFIFTPSAIGGTAGTSPMTGLSFLAKCAPGYNLVTNRKGTSMSCELASTTTTRTKPRR